MNFGQINYLILKNIKNKNIEFIEERSEFHIVFEIAKT